MRVYDEMVGRFLSVDPLTREYPWYTPYQYAGNKPIYAIDLDGNEDIGYGESNNYLAVKYGRETVFQVKKGFRNFNYFILIFL